MSRADLWTTTLVCYVGIVVVPYVRAAHGGAADLRGPSRFLIAWTLGLFIHVPAVLLNGDPRFGIVVALAAVGLGLLWTRAAAQGPERLPGGRQVSETPDMPRAAGPSPAQGIGERPDAPPALGGSGGIPNAVGTEMG